MEETIAKGLPITVGLVVIGALIAIALIEPIQGIISLGSILGFFLTAYLIGKFIHE